MTARQVDLSARELRELRSETVYDALLGLAAALGAWAIHGVAPALTVPLVVGAVLEAFRCGDALLRRQELLEHLAGDRQAYGLEEVQRYVARLGSPLRRRRLAGALVPLLALPSLADERQQLEQLVRDLEDPTVEIDPFAIVELHRLVDDPQGPLGGAVPALRELHAALLRIGAGFRHPQASG